MIPRCRSRTSASLLRGRSKGAAQTLSAGLCRDTSSGFRPFLTPKALPPFQRVSFHIRIGLFPPPLKHIAVLGDKDQESLALRRRPPRPFVRVATRGNSCIAEALFLLLAQALSWLFRRLKGYSSRRP